MQLMQFPVVVHSESTLQLSILDLVTQKKDNVIYVCKFVNFDEYALRFVSQSRFQICLVSNLNSN